MIESKLSSLRCCIRLIFVSVLIYIATASADAFAHKASDSYLKIRGGESTLNIQWHIAIKDLELMIGVDSNRDGEVTWGELRGRQKEISAHALSHLKFSADGIPCRLQCTQMLFTEHSDGGYAVLDVSIRQKNTEMLATSKDVKCDTNNKNRIMFENCLVSIDTF